MCYPESEMPHGNPNPLPPAAGKYTIVACVMLCHVKMEYTPSFLRSYCGTEHGEADGREHVGFDRAD